MNISVKTSSKVKDSILNVKRMIETEKVFNSMKKSNIEEEKEDEDSPLGIRFKMVHQQIEDLNEDNQGH